MRLSIEDIKFIVDTISLEICREHNKDINEIYWKRGKSGNYYWIDKVLKDINGKAKIWFKKHQDEF